MADLQNHEEKAKCLANDENCKSCFEDKCNKKAKYSECYTTVDPYVKESPPFAFDTKSLRKLCTNYDDKCFLQVLENETVIRGCVGDYAAQNDLSIDFLSNVLNKSKYQICSGNLCNERIKAKFCLSCNSDDDKSCISKADIYHRKRCPLEPVDFGCYHYINESYVERGCITNIEHGDKRNDCQSDSDNCKKCFGMECNHKNNFMSCYSSDNADYNGRSKICKRYDNECFIHASGDVVRRGCLRDFVDAPIDGIDIVSDCKDTIICERCFHKDCNTRRISRERCISCERNVHGIDCIHFPSVELEELCPFSMKPLGCYLRQDEFRFARGCISSLKGEERQECQQSTGDCKTCLFGANCNIKRQFPVCTDCSTTIDGKDCQLRPSKLKTKQCPNYMDQCYIYAANGIVERNCTNDLLTPEWCASHPKHCLLCADNTRNEKIIESEFCADCDSIDDIKCQSSISLDDESLFKECPIALTKKGCYHFIGDKSKRHIRGTEIRGF